MQSQPGNVNLTGIVTVATSAITVVPTQCLEQLTISNNLGMAKVDQNLVAVLSHKYHILTKPGRPAMRCMQCAVRSLY